MPLKDPSSLKSSDYYAGLLGKPEVRAGLDMIAYAEGLTYNPNTKTAISRDQSYLTAYNYNPITSTDWHPETVYSGTPRSSASGRYQFMRDTWNEVANAIGLTDFSPRSQDIAALARIDQRYGLDKLLAGDVKGFINATAKEWASFPGANYPGQSMRGFDDLVGRFEAARKSYAKEKNPSNLGGINMQSGQTGTIGEARRSTMTDQYGSRITTPTQSPRPTPTFREDARRAATEDHKAGIASTFADTVSKISDLYGVSPAVAAEQLVPGISASLPQNVTAEQAGQTFADICAGVAGAQKTKADLATVGGGLISTRGKEYAQSAIIADKINTTAQELGVPYSVVAEQMVPGISASLQPNASLRDIASTVSGLAGQVAAVSKTTPDEAASKITGGAYQSPFAATGTAAAAGNKMASATAGANVIQATGTATAAKPQAEAVGDRAYLQPGINITLPQQAARPAQPQENIGPYGVNPNLPVDIDGRMQSQSQYDARHAGLPTPTARPSDYNVATGAPVDAVTQSAPSYGRANAYAPNAGYQGPAASVGRVNAYAPNAGRATSFTPSADEAAGGGGGGGWGNDWRDTPSSGFGAAGYFDSFRDGFTNIALPENRSAASRGRVNAYAPNAGYREQSAGLYGTQAAREARAAAVDYTPYSGIHSRFDSQTGLPMGATGTAVASRTNPSATGSIAYEQPSTQPATVSEGIFGKPTQSAQTSTRSFTPQTTPYGTTAAPDYSTAYSTAELANQYADYGRRNFDAIDIPSLAATGVTTNETPQSTPQVTSPAPAQPHAPMAPTGPTGPAAGFTPQVGQQYDETDLGQSRAPGSVVNSDMTAGGARAYSVGNPAPGYSPYPSIFSPLGKIMTPFIGGFGQPGGLAGGLFGAVAGALSGLNANDVGGTGIPTFDKVMSYDRAQKYANTNNVAMAIGKDSGGRLGWGNAGALSAGAASAGWMSNNPERSYSGYGSGYDPTPT